MKCETMHTNELPLTHTRTEIHRTFPALAPALARLCQLGTCHWHPSPSEQNRL
eukprot:SAG22_NODE_20300_length_266_cov_10.239521_1_plen_52_part_10